jgi:hypothetical protein
MSDLRALESVRAGTSEQKNPVRHLYLPYLPRVREIGNELIRQGLGLIEPFSIANFLRSSRSDHVSPSLAIVC